MVINLPCEYMTRLTLAPGSLKHMEEITVFSNTNTIRPAQINTFIDKINADRLKLNNLIDQYNQASDISNKRNLLHRISQESALIPTKYPPSYLAYCTDVTTNLQIELFENIKEQREYLDSVTLVSSTQRDCSLDVIIERMSPHKMAILMSILNQGASFNQSAFNSLYTLADPKNEYDDFQTFLNTHNPITYLGGNNSKNFKVEPLNGQPSYALKLENRLDQPETAEIYLREHSLKEILTQKYISRNGTFRWCYDTINKSYVTLNRNIVITDLCLGGNLIDHAATIAPLTTQRIDSALNIYRQMSQILDDIRQDHCAFPDMKNSNWLIDESGDLWIADTKSFLFTDAQGNIQLNIPENAWADVISTDSVSPLELTLFDDKDHSSADKMHAYMLGKNLYQYLTGCNDYYLNKIDDGLKFDFSNTIFKSQEGLALKSLIKSLVRRDALYRPSISEALETLIDIELNMVKNSFDKYLIFITEDPNLSALHQKFKSCVDLGDIYNQQKKLDKALLTKLQQECLFVSSQNNEGNIQKIEQWREKIVSQKSIDGILPVHNQLTEERFQLQCLNLLKAIEEHAFGKNDSKMSRFIKEKSLEITLADKDELNALFAELTLILNQLQHVDIRNIKKIIESDRGNETVHKIKEVVSQVPVEERVQISGKEVAISAEAQNARTLLHTHYSFVAPQVNYKKRLIETLAEKESNKIATLDDPRKPS